MSDVGLATACVLVPVPHRATVRAVVFAHAGKRDGPSAPTTIPVGWPSRTRLGNPRRFRGAHRVARHTTPQALYDSSVLAVLGTTGGGFASPVAAKVSFWRGRGGGGGVRALATVGYPIARA